MRRATQPTEARPATEPVLSIRDLRSEFDTNDGVVHAVDGVSFDLYAGETLGIVGESGSGKSVSAMSLLGLLDKPAGRVIGGELLYKGRDLRLMTESELRRIRGKEIAMVFQDPMTSLNPVITVGKQIVEVLQTADPSISRSDARRRAIELLALVGVPDPEKRFDQHPFEYSGGMRQRGMIAMAIANQPSILIADEPTTALDVTIQAQVLDVLRDAQNATGAATIMITHDLGVIAEMADRVAVMYAGRIVEIGDVEDVFRDPKHPYTVGLMASLPRLDTDLDRLIPIEGMPPSLLKLPPGCPFHPRCPLYQGRSLCHTQRPPLVSAETTDGAIHGAACHFVDEVPAWRRAIEEAIGVSLTSSAEPMTESTVVSVRISDRTPDPKEKLAPKEKAATRTVGEEILQVEGLKKHFPVRGGFLRNVVGTVRAVDGVDFTLRAGETLGLVGESGCGKSTTGRTVMRLLDPTEGRIVFKGRDITHTSRKDLRPIRREMQILFQDPFSSLDPRTRVEDIIGEPLRIHGLYERTSGPKRVKELMELVGLNPEHSTRYAHQFSGGQRQRIGVARAIALNPSLLILDEPVSALDVSIQAQVVNLLMELQKELGLAYLFIAHDLGVIRQISQRIAVMYLGRIVEIGDKHDVYERPTHPYTQSLLSAVPVPDPAQRSRRNRIVLVGDVPNPANPPLGCNFNTRCFKAQDVCRTEDPALLDREGHGHPSACLFPEVNPVLPMASVETGRPSPNGLVGTPND
jgi:peptide/nickel transport system ATP-binding protein